MSLSKSNAPGSVLSLSSHSTGSLRLAPRDDEDEDDDDGPGRRPSNVAMVIDVCSCSGISIF